MTLPKPDKYFDELPEGQKQIIRRWANTDAAYILCEAQTVACEIAVAMDQKYWRGRR